MHIPTIDSLYEVLQKMVGLHRQLHDLCRQERDSLVSADVDAIQKFASAKGSTVEQIKVQELERIRLSAELAGHWQRPLVDMTLNAIIRELEPADAKVADRFRSTLNALTILIERTRAVNDANRTLIERSLEHVHSMKRNVLGEGAPKSDTYGSQGQKIPQTGGARLLSQEA